MIQRIRKKIQRTIYTGDNQIGIRNIRYLPRWIVLALDSFLVLLSIMVSQYIIHNLGIDFYDTLTLAERVLLIFGVNFCFFFVFKTYSGLIRHSTFTDIVKLLIACFGTISVLTLINYTYFLTSGDRIFIMPGLFIYLVLSFSFLLLFRVLIKQLYQFFKDKKRGAFKKRVVIFGTDDNAISIAEALNTDSVRPFELVGFISPNKTYKHIRILDRPVIRNTENIYEHLKSMNVHGILIMGDSMSKKLKDTLIDECLASNIQIFNVPSVEEWDNKKDLNQQIKTIQIEDLLNREEVELDTQIIKSDLENKVILVTGGAGSIGSELVRQISKFNPKLIVILDQAETALYDLELELLENFPNLNFVTELANISNMYRITMLFEKYNFDLLYHAAAYKHVPIIERNPHEAIYVNILGTMNLVKMALATNISKFVMVSTDKAVNPTNVMGATKRAAEMYVQSLQQESNITTRFITTRFGNVLGSNGSVIPHFKRQIAKGGPVTVTHPDIIRYFMTIPEACQLVLQAGTMGLGGEIYVFDMGKPIRIMDLAKRMIQLSGFVPEEEIKIEVTGLRPGEKLYEELLADSSVNLPTQHSKIMVSKDKPLPFGEMRGKYESLVRAALKKKDDKVVHILKEIVVEYKSENSIFSELDLPEVSNGAIS